MSLPVKQQLCDCSGGENAGCCGSETGLTPLFQGVKPAAKDEVCCGAPPGPASGPLDRPGYILCDFVEDFVETPAGAAPRVKTVWGKADFRGMLRVRLGIGRNDYRVAPGLYAVGRPGPESEVLVTANYKLSFDLLRKALDGLNAWILVVDTRGVNVWCAAGKKTFSSAEVIRMAQKTGLSSVVSHNRLILPQLSATGVSAIAVKRGCGFEVIWGPIRAEDIKGFLENGNKAAAEMRQVTFSVWERIVLIPVELAALPKLLAYLLIGMFLLSGFGTGVYSLVAAWERGLMGAAALFAGILAGAILTPVLLPHIPGVRFSVKGAIMGAMLSLLTTGWFWPSASALELIAICLFIIAASSYLAMNYTGATPFTSPSGVEKEMRQSLPFQFGGLGLAVVLWLISGWTRVFPNI